MTPEAHAAFTAALRDALAREPEVLGLVTLGSTSGQPPLPDAFSDHDFFVVTRPGAQERFRRDLAWIPARLAFSYRATAHGVTALTAEGHLLEFAVFDLDELRLARVNRYAVPLDRGAVAARMREVRAESERHARDERPGREWLIGQLLSALVIGAGRAARGERLAGRQRLHEAAGHLLRLAALRAERPGALDDLDPWRRVEAAWPGLAGEVESALRLDPAPAALALLSCAGRLLGDDLPRAGAEATRLALGRAAAAASPA